MATIKRQDVCFGIEYLDQTKQKKTRWVKIGKAFHSDSGSISIKLDTIPASGWDGWINLFDEKDQNQIVNKRQEPVNTQTGDQPVHQSSRNNWNPQEVGLPPMEAYEIPASKNDQMPF